jgi:hypothetical protein
VNCPVDTSSPDLLAIDEIAASLRSPAKRRSAPAGYAAHAAQPLWLTASEAQAHLRCDAVALGRLITQGLVHAFRAPAKGLLFRLDELDAAPTPLEAGEALRLLGEASPDSGEPSDMPSTTKSSGAPSDDTRSLKEAAVILDMPYKTLLRLASEGAIPAVDLNAHRGRQRARYVVSISALRQHLKNQGDKQSAMRRARQPGIDLARLAQPRGGGR